MMRIRFAFLICILYICRDLNITNKEEQFNYSQFISLQKHNIHDYNI